MNQAQFFDHIVLRFITPFLRMGSFLYLLVIIIDGFTDHSYRWLAVAIALVQISLFMSVVNRIISGKIPHYYAHRIAYLTVLLVLSGVCFRSVVLDDSSLPLYAQETMVLCGMVMLSRRWFLVSTLTCFAAWASCSFGKLPTDEFIQAGFECAIVASVSAACLGIRLRVFKKQHALRLLEESQQRRLAVAIEEGVQAGDALAAKMEVGSKKIADTVVRLRSTLAEQEVIHQKLLHSQRIEAMGRLAGGIAHEFSNLLTIMLGTLHELRRTAKSDEVLDEVEEATQRGRDLIGGLVSLTGHKALQRRTVSVGQMLSEQSKLLNRALPEHIEWSLTVKDPDVRVHVDQNALYQVFQNLVKNGHQAIQGTGTIKFHCYPHGQTVRFEIRDSGPGLKPEALESMFEPFFTTKPMGEGTGLGLAIAKGVVEGHGGTLRLISTGTNGSKFRVTLPKSDCSLREPDSEERKARGFHGETILLVEDESSILKLTSRYLRRKGYSVLVAPDGERALELLESKPDVALVVTDVIMPKLDGPSLANLVEAQHPDLPFLFVSGYPDDKLERLGLNKEDVNFLAKPYDLEELGLKVVNLLGQTDSLSRKKTSSYGD